MGDTPQVRIKEAKTALTSRPGMAGKVAVVGAFDSNEKQPVVCLNPREAYNKLGTDKTFNGVACIDKLFNQYGGASSLIAINTTVKTGDEGNETVDKEMTPEKLSTALSQIKGEDFDILFVADELNDEGLTIVKTFLEESYELKKPNGFIAPLGRGSADEIIASHKMFTTGLYGFVIQQYTIDGTELSLIESAAYYCGIIAGLKVNQSMTMKIIPGVEKITPEYTYEDGDDGKKLVNAGVSVAKCVDRMNKEFVIVNSELPNGYDLYIERTKNFIIKEFNLEKFLGEKGNEATITAIKSELETIKQKCVNSMNLLEDINYSVEKTSPNCVEIYLDSLKFIGIITKIDVYVTIEVE